MININRSTDYHDQTVWVATEIDLKSQRCRQLYCGDNINGAVLAATSAGMPNEEARALATKALNRRDVVDQLT